MAGLRSAPLSNSIYYFCHYQYHHTPLPCSFSRQGSNAAREDSDAGFYDPVPSFDPAAAAGRGSGGSFGRGGYNNGNRREGGRSNGTGQYYQQQGGSRQYNQGATRSYSGEGRVQF